MGLLQRGTGYHVDIDPLAPFGKPGRTQWRPFQGLVALSDQHVGDASLEVVPGFHRACQSWYLLASSCPARPVGEWGFAVKVDRGEDRPIVERFQVATRIPDGWSPSALPPAALPERREDAIAWLDRCRRELAVGRPRPLRAGDYVLWDPRMAHANGAANTSSVARRCMYLAYVPAVAEHRPLLARILQHRRQGLPGLEANAGPAEPDHRAVALPPGSLAERLYGAAEWPEQPTETEPVLTATQRAFFDRYGYLVIEESFTRREVDALNAATDAFIRRCTGVDPSRPATLSAERWQTIGHWFGGMLQTYWLPEMEAFRLDPRPYRATADLIAATWARRRPPFEHPFEALRPHALWVHPDRQNFRWPDAVLRSLAVA
jgi:hypothetical protein